MTRGSQSTVIGTKVISIRTASIIASSGMLSFRIAPIGSFAMDYVIRRFNPIGG